MLKIEHLTKTYGEKRAVDDLSLHIRPGEIYGFIGHNGAGKTTTIKAACGILQYDSGEISLDGEMIQKERESLRKKVYLQHKISLRQKLEMVGYIISIGTNALK